MLPGDYLMLIMHNTPSSARQSGSIMEATPGFFCLSEVSWCIKCFSLHNEKGVSNYKEIISVG